MDKYIKLIDICEANDCFNEEYDCDNCVFNKIPAADVQPVVDTENTAIVSNEFICKKCGLYLKDYIKVVMDEDNDGYIDEQHYDYEPKFCPECGAKVESCIKTPKRDKPLYTMNEICKMNGVEFKGSEPEV